MRIDRSWFPTRFAFVLALAVALVAALGLPSHASAQERSDSAQLAELRAQIEALTRDLEAVRLGREIVEADSSVMGFGPAASKVYNVSQGVSLGGYGEILYERFAEEREDDAPSGRTDRFDALRGILYVGYKFNDRILFNSEIEIEHGSTERGGAASLEFAYVDYRITENFGVRGGLLLAPIGLLNELHEPPVWLGTTRSLTENRVIPTTWRENGIGVFGDAAGFSWRAYLMNSFDGAGFNAAGLRGGRQKGASALAEDLGVAARVDYQGVLGLVVGGSAYRGQTGQNRLLAGEEVDGTVTILEGHVDYKVAGLDLRGLYARATVDDAAQLNALRTTPLTGNATIGSEMAGWYVQAGYDVLRSAPTEHQLIPYVRYEAIDTQADVPAGLARGPANEGSALTLGLAWKPLVQVSVKADYQVLKTEAETGVNQLNVALGYLF